MKHARKFIIVCFILLNLSSGQEQKFQLYFGKPGEILQVYFRFKGGGDTSDVERIKRLVDSTSLSVNDEACIFLAQRGYKDILPKIKNNFYESLKENKLLNAPFNYLYAIYLLDKTEALKLAHEFVETLVAWRKQKDGRYYAFEFYNPIWMLLNLGDYSRYKDYDEFVLSVKDDPEMWDWISIEIYVAFASQASLRTKVFERLKDLLNHPYSGIRSSAVFNLGLEFKDFAETQRIMRDLASSDPDMNIRDIAYSMLFFTYKDIALIDICANNILQIQDRTEFISTLWWIEYFPSPKALIALNNLKSKITSPELLSILNNTIEYYKPPEPSKDISVSTLIDTLIAYRYQCSINGWLTGEDFLSELDNYLIEARIKLTSGDSIGCARNIKQFQQAVDAEYHDSLNATAANVTTEGWKFLYYNAQYIIERLVRLPKEPTKPILEQIDSLKSELQFQSKIKGVGGAAFVKVLTLLIDKSKKELQKQDSTETALYIALFQKMIEETWELTDKKKSKKEPIIYVKDEAYISLYYRAKYILELLPMPKRSTQECREQMKKEEPAFKQLEEEQRNIQEIKE